MANHAVYKYTLSHVGPEPQLVEMPTGATLLHVGFQDHAFCVWAKVDPQALMAKRLIILAATGESIDPHHRHVLSIQSKTVDGEYVIHVFDGGEQ